MTIFFTISINNIFSVILLQLYSLILGTILRKKSMVFVYTAKGVLCVEHANVLELCYIELLSGDSSPYLILSGWSQWHNMPLSILAPIHILWK